MRQDSGKGAPGAATPEGEVFRAAHIGENRYRRNEEDVVQEMLGLLAGLAYPSSPCDTGWSARRLRQCGMTPPGAI